MRSKVSLHSQGFLMDDQFLDLEENEDKSQKLKHLLKVSFF